MRLSGSRAYYRSTPPKMPSGLVELIEGLTREVLKNNPTDIYGFCAGHVQQLLEIRDGPLKKKTLTLEEKIAKAQEKIRQRAEQRRQQYNNDLLKQQIVKNPEINATAIEDDTPPIISKESFALNTLKTPIHNEQELVNSPEVELSHKSCTASRGNQYQNIDEITIKDNADLNNEPMVTAYGTKSNINLAESTNETGNSITQDAPLTMPSNTETHNTNVENMLDKVNLTDLYEPIADGQVTHGEKEYIIEKHGLVAVTDLQELDAISPKQHILSPINSMIDNQDCELFDSGEKIIEDSTLVETEKTAGNELGEKNVILQTVDVIADDIAETQNDKGRLLFHVEETLQSNNTESIHNFDSNITNRLDNMDNVELTTNSDNIVNINEEDPQETNTFDISFKESPTVELQDPIINSDMLEALPETDTDSDIVTLITQESTNNESNKHSALEYDSAIDFNTNAELSQVNKNNTESNDNTTHQKIENTNKENNGTDNVHETTIKLSDSSQIHNQDSNMDLETAAITIQKVFRTFLFKSRASTFDDTVNDETIYLSEGDKDKQECDYSIASSLSERRPHGITRMDTVLQTVNEEKSLSLSTDDSSTVSSAATVIQAHVRGFLVRNKLNSNKTVSTSSLAASNSNEPSLTSLEMDNEQNKNKTILNIHIVPEGGNYLSRDESLITSMDLSLDSSPPSSINLHPLGYDKSERRKQLKREDAIQSISPPSNNSGKLSEDVDSVKELPLNDPEITEEHKAEYNNYVLDDLHEGTGVENIKITHVENMALENIISDNSELVTKQIESSAKLNSDEMDVVTPFISNEGNNSSDKKLMHSGEFHDAVLPTKVSRSDTSVASGE